MGSCCLAELSNEQQKEHTSLLQHDQCFYLCCNPSIVDHLQRQGAYLLTPGWLQNWRLHLQEWGFGQQQARVFFNKTIAKLFLLDTGILPDSTAQNLSALATYIDRPAEQLPVGLDYLEMLLNTHIQSWRQQKALAIHHEQQRQAADYAMALDLTSRLSKSGSEVEIIESIIELFTTLFAPQHITYIPFQDDRPGKIRGMGHDNTREADLRNAIPDFNGSAFADQGNNFWLQLRRPQSLLGVIEIRDMQFPQYRQHYLNLSLTIVDICSLAIANARIRQQLTDIARLAGKAEVATEILHNVGNILNSVNISVEQATAMVQNNIAADFADIVALLQQHSSNLDHFLHTDPRGSKIMPYFNAVSDHLATEKQKLLTELTLLSKNIGHIKAIVRLQQLHAVDHDIYEQLYLQEVIDEALAIHASQFKACHITISKEYADMGTIRTSRHKILQILINLLSNAIDALDQTNSRTKIITLALRPTENGHVQIDIGDNGCGIAPEFLKKIFTYGFYSKAANLGIGLHSAANMSKVLKGSLTASSKGIDQGATFSLNLPVEEKS